MIRRDRHEAWWEGWVAVDPSGQAANWSEHPQGFLKEHGWRVARVKVLLPGHLMPPAETLVAQEVDEP